METGLRILDNASKWRVLGYANRGRIRSLANRGLVLGHANRWHVLDHANRGHVLSHENRPHDLENANRVRVLAMQTGAPYWAPDGLCKQADQAWLCKQGVREGQFKKWVLGYANRGGVRAKSPRNIALGSPTY